MPIWVTQWTEFYNGTFGEQSLTFPTHGFTATWDDGKTVTQDELALKSDLPTKTSDLTNDSGFITSADVPTPSYIEDADGNKIEADRDIIYTDNTKWSVNMGSHGTHVLSQTSIYSWEYVEPEGIEGNKKVVLSYRDGENCWFLEYYQWSFGAGTWVIFAYGRDYESPSTATSLEITITGDTSIDCTLTRGVVITGKLATLSDLPTKTSDLTNDSGFITSADVPTKTSDLTNDSKFITSDEVEPYHNFNTPTIPTGLANKARMLVGANNSAEIDTDAVFGI